jgi:hypothetical protein
MRKQHTMHPAKKVKPILDICMEYNNKGEPAKEFQNVSYLLIFDLTVSSSVCVCVCVYVGVWSAARNQL